MRKLPAFLVLTSLALAGATSAEWRPAKGPLMTRWAKEVTPDRVHPEYPRPQLMRKDWLSLNGLWDYAIRPKGDGKPEKFDGQILVPFPVEAALSGVMRTVGPDQRLWYRRTITVPKQWSGKRVLLHFGAVDWETTVWVNGKELGVHRGGYDGFSFDVTDALNADGNHELVVSVFDPSDAGTQPRGKQVRKPGGIYYTPTTGIWQTVWLEPVAAASIDGLKITPDVDAGKVRLQANVRGGTNRCLIRFTISWQEATQPGRIATFEASQESNRLEAVHEIKLRTVNLWTPETPFLYDLKVQLLENGEVVDEVASYFGMRKITIGKDKNGVTRILLNNKPVFQAGPLDQGFWPDGLYAAPTDEALRYDIEMTKKLGFNMARKHVKVEPERWYYWCDKLGLLVWQDMPSGDKSVAPNKGEITRTKESADQYAAELKRMIDGRYNHPSIIMWVVFNEGWGQFDTVRITNWTKEYDPSRLANCASGWNDFPAGDVHDIHVYPGPGAPPVEPHRAAVLGEFGGLGLGVDGHTWTNRTWGYRGTQSSEDLTRKYEKLLAGVHKLKEEKGLSAAVYTQTTDVETEANGLMTYDRAVLKVDGERIAAVNRGDLSRVPEVQVVVATSQGEGIAWRYTTEKPAGDWFKPGYDVSAWKEGPGGFGTKGTPGAVVRTEWKTDDIWLRREFTLPEGDFSNCNFMLHHDEDAEIYLNGILAAKVAGYVTDYDEVPITPEARAALKPGKNVIAVHCHQTSGGQYIDVGIVETKTRR